ncbi:MAG: alpha/beta fold hydrolase [Eubacteriales bacterium]
MSYIKTTGSYLSADKEHMLDYYVWTPESPVAVLQICHGMGELMERYEDFAVHMAQRGIVVCGSDHLGHGSSVSAEDRGFFGNSDGDVHLVDDVEGLRLLIRRRYRYLPYILLGHSMGSFIARAHMVKYKDALDGVILSGTSGGDDRIKFGLFLSGLMIKLRGGRYRSKWIKNMTMKGRNDRFKAEKCTSSWLTKDEKIRSRFDSDQRCSFIFTVRGYHDMFKLLRDVSAESWAPSVPKGLPIFIISGTDDSLGDYGKGVQQVCDRLQDAEVYDLSLKLYPGLRHEVLNEPERETVYSDIFDWIMRVREGVLECRIPTPLF